jgi:hypothetical protein
MKKTAGMRQQQTNKKERITATTMATTATALTGGNINLGHV